MALPNGRYTIVSKATDFVVGRELAEDKSLGPKGIYTLDPKVPKDGGRVWTIEHAGGGKYKLQAGGGPVGTRDGRVWAFLNEHDKASAGEWRIEDVSYQGEHNYIIVRPNLEVGWVAEFEDPDMKPIKARPLIVHPSYPPRYPEFEVFVIKPLED